MNNKTAPPLKEKPADKPVVSSPPVVSAITENRYYNFIEAQVQRNKGNLDKAFYYLKKAIENDPESSYLQRELAILYLQEENNEKALTLIESLLEREPNDVATLIIYGGIKQGLKDFDNAQKAYEKVIANDPTRQNIYLHLGDLYLQKGDLEKAFQVYKRLVQNFPASYVGHYYLGKIHAEQGNPEAAERELKKTLELEPDLEEPRYELINLYQTQKKEKNIIQLYKDILKKNPRNIKAAIGIGFFYHKNGMVREAEKIFKDLGTRSQSETEVIRTLVALYLEPKKYDAAIIVLEGMLKGAPDSPDLHYLTGMAFDGKNDKDRALMHLKRVAPGSSFYQNAAINISFIYQEQGKIKEAINYLEGIIKKVTDNPEIMLYLGSFYEETEEYEKAEKVVKQGLEIDPDSARLHFRLGVIYDKWGRKEASIDEMKSVLKIDPKNANALNYLGYTYAELGQNLDEAERFIKEALQYMPDDGYIIDSLGWVYFKKGLFNKALKLLEKAVKLVPDDPVILEHLGDAYLKTNNKKKALKIYKRSLRKKKNDKLDLERKIQELTGSNIETKHK